MRPVIRRKVSHKVSSTLRRGEWVNESAEKSVVRTHIRMCILFIINTKRQDFLLLKDLWGNFFSHFDHSSCISIENSLQGLIWDNFPASTTFLFIRRNCNVPWFTPPSASISTTKPSANRNRPKLAGRLPSVIEPRKPGATRWPPTPVRRCRNRFERRKCKRNARLTTKPNGFNRKIAMASLRSSCCQGTAAPSTASSPRSGSVPSTALNWPCPE